jgi:hypothetical protein
MVKYCHEYNSINKVVTQVCHCLVRPVRAGSWDFTLDMKGVLVTNLMVDLPRATLTRVNSTNVLDAGLMIGEIGRRMNSNVKPVKQGVYRK